MIDPTVPDDGVPKPAPDVNEVRIWLEALAGSARWVKTFPVGDIPDALDCLSVMAERALSFLPAAEPPSEAA